ncbi:MAG: hypothetical protein Q7R47_06255 [Candidatus Diapherotrites archaeon]|nr:hypothetical protein [Candidatus Diapherotrites archaeon]
MPTAKPISKARKLGLKIRAAWKSRKAPVKRTKAEQDVRSFRRWAAATSALGVLIPPSGIALATITTAKGINAYRRERAQEKKEARRTSG